MPFLIPPLPPQSIESRSLWKVEETAVSQGLEGQQIREQIENVSRHWRQHSLASLEAAPSDLLDELSDYQHPSFERVGKVRVRFARITDLQPRQFNFDEEDE